MGEGAQLKFVFTVVFFFGGPKAMVKGVLEAERKDLGLTVGEFREFPDYDKFKTKADRIAKFMGESSVIEHYKLVAKYIHESHINKALVGPRGHSYAFKKDVQTIKKAYPNFLQSYEFYILAKSTIAVKGKETSKTSRL